MSWAFLATALLVVMAPGTGVIFTLATGLTRGRLAAVAAAVGCTIGIVPSLLAALFGLAAVLYSSALLFQVVKFAGVAFLLYLAWQTLQNDDVLTVDEKQSPKGLGRIALNATLINILNPKLALFFMAFLPQFLSGNSASATSEMLTLGGAFMGLTFIVFIAYGVFAASARDLVLGNARVMGWIRRGFAASFAGLAAKLAFEKA
ncbi:LysE family translocator [Aliiroseovarius crassostreae]|uniref:LysE family translocator n=1 Tax=Aliiroseovarius crassostreae TaxID=154981 RepID=UPI003C7B7CBC